VKELYQQQQQQVRFTHRVYFLSHVNVECQVCLTLDIT